MASLHTYRFAGIRPATHDKLLEAQRAKQARNVRLTDGTLRPMKDTVEVKAAGEFVPKAVHLTLSSCDGAECPEIKCFEECSAAIHTPIPGLSEFNQVLVLKQAPHEYGGAHLTRCLLSTGEECPAYLPYPHLPPVATVTLLNGPTPAELTEYDKQPDAVDFFYTWVDKLGIESGPSPMSNIVDCYYEGSTVEMTGFADPPASAECLRVYRYVSPHQDEAEINPVAVPPYLLVGEYPLDGAVAFDPLVVTHCGEDSICAFDPTLPHTPPPADMCGLAYTEGGYTVGWSGKYLYVSARNCDHIWPEEHTQCLPYEICSVVAQGNFVYVGTKSYPFIVSFGEDEKGKSVIKSRQLPDLYPVATPQSMVATNFGAMYASKRGLVILRNNGQAQLVSKPRIDDCDWPQYLPALGAWHNGKYIGFRPGSGFGIVFDVSEGTEGSLELGDLYVHDINAVAAHSGHDGRLYVVKPDGSVHAWAQGPQVRPYKWRSKTTVFPGDTKFSAFKIVGDFGPAVTLRIFNKDGLAYQTTVDSCKPCRLPLNAVCRSTEWCFELEGTTTIHEVHLGTSLRALAEAA